MLRPFARGFKNMDRKWQEVITSDIIKKVNQTKKQQMIHLNRRR